MNPNLNTIQPQSVGLNPIDFIFPHHCLQNHNNMKGETVEQTFYSFHENGKFIAVTKRRDINYTNTIKGSINFGVLWTNDNKLNDKFFQQMVDRHQKITAEEFEEQFNSIVPDLNNFLNQIVDKPEEQYVSVDKIDEDNPIEETSHSQQTEDVPF